MISVWAWREILRVRPCSLLAVWLMNEIGEMYEITLCACGTVYGMATKEGEHPRQIHGMGWKHIIRLSKF